MATVVETHEHETSTAVEQVVTGPARLMQFFHDTRAEMHKVISPTGAEVRSTTTVVIVTVFAFAAYFYIVDTVFGGMVDQMFKWLAKH